MRLMDNGIYDEGPINRQQRDPNATEDPAAAPSAAPATPAAPAMPTTPVDTPGPASDPSGDQGGRPAPAPSPNPGPQAPPPPAISTAVSGLEGSADTGGVKGTFEQAGTSGFNQKFGGGPAAWFRNMGAASIPKAAGPGGDRSAVVRGGSTAGGAIPTASPTGDGADAGAGAGVDPNSPEWQKFMQAVMAQRFGRG